MSELSGLFADNLLPIVIVAGVGFLLYRLLAVDPQPISQIVFYALSPALVFNLLLTSEIPANDILTMAAMAGLTISIIVVLSWMLGRLNKLEPTLLSAFILSSSFMNAGNYGLSLIHFSLGDLGLAWASIFFITSSMMVNSLGVYVATAGNLSPKNALRGLLKVPAVYAIPLALIIRSCGLTLPVSIIRPIELLGSAAIPCSLTILGMQIGRLVSLNYKRVLASAVGLRLFLSPVLAWVLSLAMGLTDVGAKAGVLEAAMPSAVFSMVIATKFDVEPEFVTSAVVVTTLLSPLTVTPLLKILGVQ